MYRLSHSQQQFAPSKPLSGLETIVRLRQYGDIDTLPWQFSYVQLSLSHLTDRVRLFLVTHHLAFPLSEIDFEPEHSTKSAQETNGPHAFSL
jgi:hypothetical protein